MPPNPARRRAPSQAVQRYCLVACLFVLAALGAWRVDQFSDAPVTKPALAASFDERRLTALVDTVAGDGLSDVRLALRADDSWSVLVLVDAEAQLTDELLVSLIGSAFALDPMAGDEVIVRRVPFARASLADLKTQHLVEMFMLILAAGLVGGALILTVRQDNDAGRELASSRAVLPPSREAAVDPYRSRAARQVNEDPSEAASVLRRWLRHEPLDA